MLMVSRGVRVLVHVVGVTWCVWFMLMVSRGVRVLVHVDGVPWCVWFMLMVSRGVRVLVTLWHGVSNGPGQGSRLFYGSAGIMMAIKMQVRESWFHTSWLPGAWIPQTKEDTIRMPIRGH